jgi:hypothetical protein
MERMPKSGPGPLSAAKLVLRKSSGLACLALGRLYLSRYGQAFDCQQFVLLQLPQEPAAAASLDLLLLNCQCGGHR